MSAADWAATLFRRIAVPRPPGSQAVADVEGIIVEKLRGMGFAVRLQDFHATPRRIFAPSIAGAGLGWVALGCIPLLTMPFPGWSATLAGITALGAVALIALGIAEGQLPFKVASVEASNVVAARSASPRLWLVAHSDSKTQRLSLRGRVIGVGFAGIGTVGLAVLLILRFVGPLGFWIAGPVCGLALVGGAMLSLHPLHDGSAGAVDNASGVIAVLVAAERLRGRKEVGVLITGAEEYGMEGARAWVAAQGGTGSFVNFDGIDAHGAFNLMNHPSRRRGEKRASGFGVLRRRIVNSLEGLGHGVRRSPLPLGVFVDGSVLAAGGLEGITVSRGTMRTLAVVHTAKDTTERTDVSAAVAAGLAVADAIDAALG